VTKTKDLGIDRSTAGACPAPLHPRDTIVLGHGSGGRLSADLIERLIVPALDNPELARLEDQATLRIGDGSRVAFTTDSYVVTPLFFPGGDIASLAVNGTINDLAVGGAHPLGLSLALIIEEGLPMATLRRVIESVRAAASRAHVPIVTGDTKVIEARGPDGLYITTSGIGVIPAGVELGTDRIRPGDVVLLSGTVGDHGVAVMTRRKELALDGDLRSDTAPLHELVRALLGSCPHVHAMRDPTRGGLAATLVEIASRRRLGIEIDEAKVPIRDEVHNACELLGLDPWLVANEGKLVAFVPEEHADRALAALLDHPLGRHAARIGTVTAAHAGAVIARTALGTERIVDLPLHELLPRIC
jgi:hydrogenase expression/formation protein HypE